MATVRNTKSIVEATPGDVSADYMRCPSLLAAKGHRNALSNGLRWDGMASSEDSATLRPGQMQIVRQLPDYHQQYLAKNPNGYCGLGGTGVSCPIGVA